ncbi:hypothetical protein [Pontitalea aquivivens]|uniref:hypothetical protein n=1 Tax=Pontitalea aquivivens TaxID=3388663 RepID=UPI003970BF09
MPPHECSPDAAVGGPLVTGDGATGDDATGDGGAAGWLDPALLGDVDAWDLQRAGGWLRFQARLPGAPGGTRRYLRPVTGGGIVAETGGAVLGLFGLGGGRHATTFPGAPAFAHHVVTAPPPEPDEPDRILRNLRESSGESALADALLGARHAAFRALPLIVTGHDLVAPAPVSAPDPDHLAQPLAALADRLDRLAALARALNRPARLLALRVAPGPDQAPADADAFHRAALAQLDAIAAQVAGRDLGRTRFLAVADCGTWWQHDAAANRAAIEGMHRLILRPGVHQLIVAAPGYMFAQDDLGQPTPQALAARAAIEAHALAADLARQDWACPLLCLAERHDGVIRATFKTLGPLRIDPADPFGAGPAAGFALAGTGAGIAAVTLAPDDPGAVLIRADGPLLPGPGANELRLDYATGGPPRPRGIFAGPGGGFGPACGALRDDWSAPAPDAGTGAAGGMLHRWALPASLVIR